MKEWKKILRNILMLWKRILVLILMKKAISHSRLVLNAEFV